MKLSKWFKRRKLLFIYRHCSGVCDTWLDGSCEHYNYHKCQILVEIDKLDEA
jgi:hypothetical protein